MAEPEVGGDKAGGSREGVGTPESRRDLVTRSEESGRTFTEHEGPQSTEDYYADYINRPRMESGTPKDDADRHRNGDYPADAPPPPSDADRNALLARNHVDPGTAKKEMFIRIADFEDPSTGKALPGSPVEVLRQDLDRLRGLGGRPSLEVLVTRAALTDRDLGGWQAGADLKATTDTAQTSLKTAVTQLCATYEAIVETLDQTVQAAKAADRSAAQGIRGTAQ